MTDDPLSLRRARPEDATALEALLLDTFERTWRPQLTAAAATAFLHQRRAAAYVAQCGAEFWVATRSIGVPGFVHWQSNFIHALHVGSPFTRTGVGTRLMNQAEAVIAESGHAAAQLETDTFNVGSRAFYAARGYREIDSYPDEEWGSGLITVLMTKVLA